MELKVSRPIQILALVLVIAGVGGIASMSVLGKSSGAAASDSGQLSVAQIRARAHKGVVPPVVKTTPAKPTTVAAKPAVTPVKRHVAAKPAPPKTPKVTVAANGLPIVLVDALRAHRMVVVSVFDPQSSTDAVSYAEARAAAGDTNAGFLGVSVLDDSIAGPLTAALPGGGLLPVPGVLIYRAPGVLVQRIDGFQDRTGVAQVVVASRTAAPLAAPAAAAATTPAVAVPTPTPALP